MIIGITDRSLYGDESLYLRKVSMFLRSSIEYLIIREKDLDSIQYNNLIKRILVDNYKYKSKIIVHTHIDVAKKYGIKRVHLPESMIETKMCNTFKYSYSIHPKTSSLDAIIEKSDFILVSPVFETSCKPDAKTLDNDLLKELRKKYNEKLVLLGGINVERMLKLKREGYLNFAFRSGLEEVMNISN